MYPIPEKCKKKTFLVMNQIVEIPLCFFHHMKCFVILFWNKILWVFEMYFYFLKFFFINVHNNGDCSHDFEKILRIKFQSLFLWKYDFNYIGPQKRSMKGSFNQKRIFICFWGRWTRIWSPFYFITSRFFRTLKNMTVFMW